MGLFGGGGFLSDTASSLFGGEDKSAQRSTKKMNKANIKFLEDQLARSRGELLQGYPMVSDARNAGAQAIADLMGSSAQSRYAPMMQGNMMAQDTLGQGSGQFANALMGRPVDRSYMQARMPQPDMSWMQNVQLPQSGIGGLAALFEPDRFGPKDTPEPAPQPTPQPSNNDVLREYVSKYSAGWTPGINTGFNLAAKNFTGR